jgi:hypothetical protein
MCLPASRRLLHMKLLLVPPCLLLLAGPRDEVTLAFAPRDETVLLRTFDAEASYRLAGVSYRIGDQEIEPDGFADLRMEFQEHIQVRDELGVVADGRPASLVRRFDELSQETSWSAGEEESTSSGSSPFQDRRVRFTWSDEDERYEAAAADDEELDDELAALLDEDMDLRLLLPADEVEVGDSWELDARIYLAFMWPSGLLEWQDDGQEEDTSTEDRERNRQTIENLSGAGTATLEELREEDGRRLAVIAVELDIETRLEFEQEPGEVTVTTVIERELAGRILWDIDAGHATSAELEGDAARTTTRSGEVENEEGETFDLAETERHEGTVRYRATIERE